MFNLLVQSGGWPAHQSDFESSRIFEYTDDHIRDLFTVGGRPNFRDLMALPALFMPEQNSGDNMARVGTITRVTSSGARSVRIEYSYDPKMPAVSVDWIGSIASDLGMHDWEFSRTHWAVKEPDLFRAIITAMQPQQNQAIVFNVPDKSAIQRDQISVMMPFDRGFDGTYEAIRRAGATVRMRVNRADNIWEHHAIIQDIVSLIARSQIIVADCTGMNPNVFYEIGIAHAIGREVILITQNMDHIPFDLRHLRALTYHPNGEGLDTLQIKLTDRIQTLLR
ncbi:hypothetical protein [Rhodobacter sp. SY28-1]|uniref:hypothetical protein n=1 Tax=Rhodobacter sp. SY28-1 TaxID=2562317 RepID=UPI00148501C0|nr:hypothetical protein [Rhodobacter sp. SY28-1]